MHDYGSGGLAQDHDKAMSLFNRAARLGYGPARDAVRGLEGAATDAPSDPFGGR